ncbi:MAG: HYR domain-containing protein [Pedosphaera sp.]|nr:HYR domain-containing protein [Pedosphaera sp.]
MSARQECGAWTYTLPNLTSQVLAKDNCTPANQIKVTQEPGPGLVLTAGRTCIKFTATDLAGNTSTCTTCFDVHPLHVMVTGATPGVFGILTAGPCGPCAHGRGDSGPDCIGRILR